jgi:hypothetical protein
MALWSIAQKNPDDPEQLTIVADEVEGTDAGDAVNHALMAGQIALTSTNAGEYRVYPLEGARDYNFSLTINDLGSV